MRVRRRLRRLKRLTYLGAFGGIIVTVRRAKARREAQPLVGPPASWPPLEVSEPPVAALGDVLTDEPRWVPPVEGVCPVTHPVKANASSRIYHEPGGAFYDRTKAERCYGDAASAEADGYRAAKGS